MTKTSMVALAVGLGLVGSAFADDAVRFTKPETEALVATRKIEWVRTRDDAKITWSLKEDGNAFFTTTKTTRNINIAGTYSITDRGSLCFKWTQDKYFPLQDGCYGFTHDGGKTMVINPNDPSNPLGHLAE